MHRQYTPETITILGLSDALLTLATALVRVGAIDSDALVRAADACIAARQAMGAPPEMLEAVSDLRATALAVADIARREQSEAPHLTVIPGGRVD